ncbi:MAG: Gfo/Idh/MocA family oxidoreductase [Clostridia bacterium]|jgi:dihydrodiol dehydrogenase / D-xylose 1-dehydrogenase (NADP)|nr:Gfo/Idh/MocA family oxidoreductase [Clostridia bacterium]MBT7122508.1 Gfo/Idh/MocA family oxidoreductase [Clostridia bacterium]
MSKTKWGIVSTGKIANQFAQCLKFVKGAQIEAVASRSIESAKAFAQKYDISKAYGSYEEMSADSEIDIAYIGTPNNAHLDDSVMFMKQGIHVLCEKPLAANEKQVRAMIQKAKENDVFFMEGMWTRFFPAVQKGLEWVKNGSIGEAKVLFASLGIVGAGDKSAWRFKREMAGGAMMDVGIYPLAMAFAAFGTDYSKITTSAFVQNGIDEVNTITLTYPDGKIAVLNSALTAVMDNNVMISGTKGCVKIGEGNHWWHAKRAELMLEGDDIFSYNGDSEAFVDSYSSIGFQYEAKAVQDYVASGAKQAKEMSWDDSIKIAQTIDYLRKQWGVKYDED